MNAPDIDLTACVCSSASRVLLQTLVAELLCKNQVLRSELQEARNRLARIERSAGIERYSVSTRSSPDPSSVLRVLFSTEA
jgi:hypothetical protein